MATRTWATTHSTTREDFAGAGPSRLVSPQVAPSRTEGEAVRYDHQGAPQRRVGPTRRLPPEAQRVRAARRAGSALAHDRLHRRFPEGLPHA